MENPDIDILLVEDSPGDAQLVFKVLKKNNMAFRLHHVEDGAEALDFLFCKGKYASNSHHARPKLVLLDLNLPKVGGIQILSEIKANKKTKMIPVVILTNSAEKSDIAECYNNYANSYLVKPVDFFEFSNTLVTLCRYWLNMNRTAG